MSHPAQRVAAASETYVCQVRATAHRHHEETAEVYSITATPRSVADQQRGRRTRYLISMGIRTLCFVLAIVVSGPLRWVLLSGAIVLPYVAVVLANAGSEPQGDAPEAPGPVPMVALEQSHPYHLDSREPAGQAPGHGKTATGTDAGSHRGR